MYKVMKALAIIVLLVTIAGAGMVLYGINTFSPVVEQIQINATPAAQAQEIFNSAMKQASSGTFTGRMFVQPGEINARDCTFLTYNARLANRGFFPAEWISLDIQPAQGDVLQLDNVHSNVLPSRSRGDISATVLHQGDASDTRRGYTICCYVFGRKITLDGVAQ